MRRLAFAWILSVVALLAGCDSRSPDAVTRLKQVYAERPAVASADNAFLDAFGFLGPADADAHELGAQRIAWFEKLRDDPKTAGTDPGKEALDTKASRLQTLRQIVDACSAAVARACGSALERVKVDEPLSDIEPVLLARYEVLVGRRGWYEIGTTVPDATLPAYQGMLDGQRLRLIRLIETARVGDVEEVRATLSRDLAYWRMMFASSDVLLSKMIALAGIRQHFAFGSHVLRQLPAGRVMEGVPAQWHQEFSAGELSMLRVMSGELLIAEGIVSDGGKSPDEIGDAGEKRDATDDVAVVDPRQRRRRENLLNDYADFYLAAAEQYRGPLTGYEAVSQKLHDEYKSVISHALDVRPYALRIGSAEGMRRAALLTAQLRSQSVPITELESRLKESPLRNPYNGEPFAWDAADQAVVYTGPEARKYRRQAYLY